LQPYTELTLQDWGAQGIGKIDVLCPGFAADCLETLEEIAIRNRETFIAAGGGDLRYIPALNARPAHIQCLSSLVRAKGHAQKPK
jgi:ferrochelatase